MKSGEEGDEFSLPLTPMIDIIFLLLIFFLLATVIPDDERNIKIELPSTHVGSPSAGKSPKKLTISVLASGEVAIADQKLPWAEVRRRVLDEGTKDPQPQIHIRADKNATWQAIGRVFQLCREADIKKINAPFEFQERMEE